MTTEYKKALDAIDGEQYPSEKGFCFLQNIEIHRRALLIADALMGNASHKMLNAAMAASKGKGDRYLAMDFWYAMRDAMLADLEKGE
jgi:hypothetical protein